MIIVHHLENSRSQRILWLLEELSLPYEVRLYKRNRKTLLAPPELKAVHPLGKSPVITDEGKVIAESAVIIDYLVNKYGQGKLRPSSADELLRYTYWLHYAEGSAMTPLLMKLIFKKVKESPMPFFAKPIVRQISGAVDKNWLGPELKLQFDYMESEISRTGWFAGDDFTAADIMMSYPIEAGSESGIKRPRLEAFLKTIKERPAYQRALEKGGPFSVIPR